MSDDTFTFDLGFGASLKISKAERPYPADIQLDLHVPVVEDQEVGDTGKAVDITSYVSRHELDYFATALLHFARGTKPPKENT